MLYGLALALRSATGDCTTNENDEFLNAGTLEVAEVADIGSVCQNHRIGSLARAFKHQQRRDLHPFPL